MPLPWTGALDDAARHNPLCRDLRRAFCGDGLWRDEVTVAGVAYQRRTLCQTRVLRANSAMHVRRDAVADYAWEAIDAFEDAAWAVWCATNDTSGYPTILTPQVSAIQLAIFPALFSLTDLLRDAVIVERHGI